MRTNYRQQKDKIHKIQTTYGRNGTADKQNTHNEQDTDNIQKQEPENKKKHTLTRYGLHAHNIWTKYG